jgi:hypothetical protein
MYRRARLERKLMKGKRLSGIDKPAYKESIVLKSGN